MSAEGPFPPGERVTITSRPGSTGTILNQRPRTGATGATLYPVDFGGGRVEWLDGQQLELITSLGITGVSRRRFLRDLAVLKLLHPFTDVLYSMGASRTRFLVYQYQPVIKFVQSMPHGMLIADEVGLGKTIEAGFILKELLARGSIQRVLVVCPANLREKWRFEMQQRFGVEFRIITAADIRSIRADVQRGGWPSFFGIMSLEGLRRDELQEVLLETGIQFDLVVIDEAHHMRNPQTLSFQLGEILSDQADHLLLLTATPVQTGAADLLALLRLIEPAQFRGTTTDDLDHLLEPNAHINKTLGLLSKPDPDAKEVVTALEGVYDTELAQGFRRNPIFSALMDKLRNGETLTPIVIAALRRDLQGVHTLAPYYTRTRKREVEDVARRRSHLYHVELSPEEATFYSAWVDYVTELAMARSGAPPAWATSMRERQAASCLPAAQDALDGLLAGVTLEDDVESSDPELAPEDWRGGLASPPLTRSAVAVRTASSQLGDHDTKADKLLSVIRDLLSAKPSRKILLFTFFKGTLRYLRKRFQSAGVGCHAISGDDKPELRGTIIENFMTDGNSSVLLSTEVGSEGLDFQFCDAVINYDLPWNPMRVEQRIGRIDRFGQREPFVDVISFFVQGTIDTRILDRLYGRIRVFEESIGELEPILGPIVQELQREAFSRRLSKAEQERRLQDALQRVENLRILSQEFESARAELMGQGDLIRTEIKSTKESGRYVSPAEVEALVAEWLESTPHSYDHLQPVERQGREGVHDIKLSESTVIQVQDQMTRESRRDGMVNAFLRRFLRGAKDRQAPVSVWCTFDSEVAQRHNGLHYIDPAHPIARTALAAARTEPMGRASGQIGCLSLPSRSSWPDRFLLFIYRLAVRGVESTASMIPVAVEVGGDPRVVEAIGDEVLGMLSRAGDRPYGLEDAVTEDMLEELEGQAFQSADARRVEAETWSRDTQAARLASRRATLERGLSARIERKRETLAKVRDPRIERLYVGEIRNLEAALEARLKDLESAPSPVATIELVSIAYIDTVRK